MVRKKLLGALIIAAQNSGGLGDVDDRAAANADDKIVTPAIAVCTQRVNKRGIRAVDTAVKDAVSNAQPIQHREHVVQGPDGPAQRSGHGNDICLPSVFPEFVRALAHAVRAGDDFDRHVEC